MPKQKQSEKTTVSIFEVNKHALKSIFEQAINEGRHLLPDEAMLELFLKWERFLETNPLTEEEEKSYNRPDKNLTRRLHRVAVDLYYDMYFGSQAGAPAINEKYLEYILSLSESGLNNAQIAKKVGLPTDSPTELTKSKDAIRHQLIIAKSRVKKSS